MAFLVILKIWAHIVTFWLTCASNFYPRFILDLSSFIFFNLELPPLLSPTSATKILKNIDLLRLSAYQKETLKFDLFAPPSSWLIVIRSWLFLELPTSLVLHRPIWDRIALWEGLSTSLISPCVCVCFSVSVFKRSRLCFRVEQRFWFIDFMAVFMVCSLFELLFRSYFCTPNSPRLAMPCISADLSGAKEDGRS